MRQLSVLTIFVILMTMWGCKPPAGNDEGRKKPETGKDGKPTEVKTDRLFLTSVLAERVRRGDVSSTIATTGTVVPTRSLLLKAEESGRLHFETMWQEGDYVTTGTLIARIESETLEQEVANARSDLKLAEESLDIAGKSRDSRIREYKTMQDLYARGIAAQKDVDSLELQAQQSINSYRREEISLRRAELNLKTVTDRLERLEIRAPFAGLLVARTTLEGSQAFSATFGSESITDAGGRLISSGAAVCGLIDTSNVLVRCDVTSRDIDAIRLGQPATSTIYARSELAVSGQVVDISKAVKESTGAFVVDVLVPNKSLELRPGMFGRVNVITKTHRDTISIPKDVITRRNNRDVVFVAEEGIDVEYSIAREVPIEVGLEARDTIEVTWGLREGDSLIIRGFEVLQDQTPINVIYPEDPVVPESEKKEEEAAPKPVEGEKTASEDTTGEAGSGV